VFTRRALLATSLPIGASELFDGRSIRGWRATGGGAFPERCWTVEDGCIKAQVSKPAFQDIRTVEEFGDFELDFEWRISPNGNSGVKYLIYREDTFRAPGTDEFHARGRGFEYQVTDDAAARTDLEEAGALYGFLAPSVRKARPVGEFNRARIVRRGTLVEHWLNDSRVVSVDLGAAETLERMRQRRVPAEFPRRSPIVLQNHSSEAWFRHLRIRAL